MTAVGAGILALLLVFKFAVAGKMKAKNKSMNIFVESDENDTVY